MRVPKSWKEVTIAQFIATHDAIQQEYDSPLDQQVAILAALTCESDEKILSLSPKELISLIKEIDFIHSLDSLSTKWPKWFMVKGRVFKPVQKLDKLTAGQYIDMMTFAKDPMPNLHKVLATICLPCRWLMAKKYDGQKHGEIAEFFYHNLTMDIAYPIAFFFCNLWENFTPHILGYLENEIQSLMKEMNVTPSLNGAAGSTPLTNSQGKTGLNGASFLK